VPHHGVALGAEVRKLRSRKQRSLVMLSSQGKRETGLPEGIFAEFLIKPIKAAQLYKVLVEIFAVAAVQGR
jgi:hypothetical protein